MTAEELEDVTSARMKNWIRPAYWVEQAMKLGQPRERRGGDEGEAPRQAPQRAEIDMELVRRLAKQQAERPGVAPHIDEADRQAILAFMRQMRQ